MLFISSVVVVLFTAYSKFLKKRSKSENDKSIIIEKRSWTRLFKSISTKTTTVSVKILNYKVKATLPTKPVTIEMSPQPQPISPAVTIAIRVRPLSQKQRKKGAKPAFAVKKQGSSSSKTTVVDDSGNSFEFDHAYAGGVSQDEIYRTAVEPLVAKFNEDLENVTILSYGQVCWISMDFSLFKSIFHLLT